MPAVSGHTFSWASPKATVATPPTPAAIDIANQALRDMFAPTVTTADQARHIGVQYAQTLLQQGGAPQAAAQATLDCVDRLQGMPLKNDGETNSVASAAALRACFQTVAAGTTGPIGQVLAQVGLKALTEKDLNVTVPQACETGLSFAHAIKASADTSNDEKTLAMATLGAYRNVSSLPDSGRTGAKILRSLMQTEAPGLTAPLGMSLARVAVAALYQEDVPISAVAACEIGLTFTHAIRDTSTRPAEQQAADDAIKAYDEAQPQPDSAKACATVLGDWLQNEAGLGGGSHAKATAPPQ